jgi:hypothetical protein
MAWVTPAQVATHVGAPVDTAMTDATNAALAWAHRQRPDLFPDLDPGDDVALAVRMYAGLLWRQAASPQGFATYSEYGGDIATGDAMANVYRLIGSRRPKAR